MLTIAFCLFLFVLWDCNFFISFFATFFSFHFISSCLDDLADRGLGEQTNFSRPLRNLLNLNENVKAPSRLGDSQRNPQPKQLKQPPQEQQQQQEQNHPRHQNYQELQGGRKNATPRRQGFPESGGDESRARSEMAKEEARWERVLGIASEHVLPHHKLDDNKYVDEIKGRAPPALMSLTCLQRLRSPSYGRQAPLPTAPPATPAR